MRYPLRPPHLGRPGGQLQVGGQLPEEVETHGLRGQQITPEALLLDELVLLRLGQPLSDLLQDGRRQEVPARSGLTGSRRLPRTRGWLLSALPRGWWIPGARPCSSRHSDASKRALRRNSEPSARSATWKRVSAVCSAAASSGAFPAFPPIAVSIGTSSGSACGHSLGHSTRPYQTRTHQKRRPT